MRKDTELIKLEKMLIGLHMLKDVREGIKKVGGKVIGEEPNSATSKRKFIIKASSQEFP
jgi:hypothetical protein